MTRVIEIPSNRHGVALLFRGSLSATAHADTILRVDPDSGLTIANGATGDDWPHAYKFLQDAIAEAPSATPPVQIWVRGNTTNSNYPDRASAATPVAGDRSARFALRANVSIFGQYIGGTGTTADNSYTVVVADGSGITFTNCILDGFTITAAANNSGGREGGGMIIRNSASPRMDGCQFLANHAGDGAGLYVNGSSPRIVNSKFIRNIADENGGGMHCVGDSAPLIVACQFLGNTAAHIGGGLASQTAVSGPGMTYVTNCTFVGNTANDAGGGARAGRGSNMTFTNCTFTHNVVGPPSSSLGFPAGGGGLAVGSSQCDYTATVVATNCIFVDNSVVDGSAEEEEESTASVYGPQIAVNGSKGSLSISWSDIEDGATSSGSGTYTQSGSTSCTCSGGCFTLTRGNGLIDVAADFVTGPSAGSGGWGSTDDNYGDLHLQNSSLCVNVGRCADVPPDYADVNGTGPVDEPTPDVFLQPRYAPDHRVDLGAAENQEVIMCPGDANGIPPVNVNDLLAVVTNWGTIAQSAMGDIGGAYSSDFPCGDGAVGVNDMLAVITNWGDNCHLHATFNVGSMSSVQDCMNAASEEYTPYSAEWNDYVTKCTNALCAANIITCD